MKKRNFILKDRSVILAVACLAAVIILFNYNKFTGAASPLTGGMGAYSGPTTNQDDSTLKSDSKQECSYCRTDTAGKRVCYKYQGTNCHKNCEGDAACQSSSGGGTKTQECSYCRTDTAGKRVCYKYQGTNCHKNCEGDAACQSSSGGGSKPPEEKPKTHKACIPVSYGSTTYTCGDVSGAGVDQCSSSPPDECKGKPAQDHQVCEYPLGSKIGKCVIIPGPGFSSCSSDVSCRPSPGRTSTIGTFFAQLWSSVVAFFSR